MNGVDTNGWAPVDVGPVCPCWLTSTPCCLAVPMRRQLPQHVWAPGSTVIHADGRHGYRLTLEHVEASNVEQWLLRPWVRDHPGTAWTAVPSQPLRPSWVLYGVTPP